METATKLRGCLEEIIAPAIVVGHRADNTNPARWKGNPSAALPKPGEVMKVTNHPANALDDAAPWFAALRRRGGIAARALEFLAITAARSGEVRGAVWDEFDLEAATWTIPAERMKTGREHRVRLSPAAVSIVRAMPEATASRYVFSARRGGQLSWMTISAGDAADAPIDRFLLIVPYQGQDNLGV